MKIGLVTCSDLPALIPGDQLLQKELLARGHNAQAVVWDSEVEWETFDYLIIRNPWDYSWRITEFLRWVTHIERLEIPLHNPPAMIRWNSSKGYLRELQAAGIAIPETEWIPSGVVLNLKKILEERKWQEAIVKPLISASARDTFRFTINEADELSAEIAKLRKTGVMLAKHSYDLHTAHREARPERDWMVQEFLPEILESGEFSFVFFNGNYSHTINKTPKAGDYRIQQRHGGTYRAAAPDQNLISQARTVLSKIPFDTSPLYARVDGIIRNNQLILTELELLEPDLYFATCPEAVKRMVEGIENI
ncbi:hypothetical protein KKC97_06995 [bacterium]|nr:hypothetical protein [bacterium]